MLTFPPPPVLLDATRAIDSSFAPRIQSSRHDTTPLNADHLARQTAGVDTLEQVDI